MKWTFSRNLYTPDRSLSWQQSHAYVPTPYLMEDRLRVFVTFWDAHKTGRVGYIDLDIKDPELREISRSENVCLDVGEKGSFDEHGVTAMCVIPMENEILLLYTGWQKQISYPYTLLTGLARSSDHGNSFERVSCVPLLDRSQNERFVRTAAMIVPTPRGLNLYYVGGDKWITVGQKKLPSYDLRLIQAEDIQLLSRTSSRCIIPLSNDEEYGFGRPWVIKGRFYWHMWYSVRTRSQGYRPGYAYSHDGLTWYRDDQRMDSLFGNAPSWATEAMAFTSIVVLQDKLYLFFNGNNHGEAGFSFASTNWLQWEEETQHNIRRSE